RTDERATGTPGAPPLLRGGAQVVAPLAQGPSRFFHEPLGSGKWTIQFRVACSRIVPFRNPTVPFGVGVRILTNSAAAASFRNFEAPMPNGHDKNWVRLCAAIDGFRVRYGHWPMRVRIFPISLADIRDHLFTPED